jgi:predicted DsbA family dithiol-disulfide isomerase
LEDNWIGFELHPEYPQEGVDLAARFPEDQIRAIYERLRTMGAQYGLEFGDVKKTPNSHYALAAGEFAATQGLFEEFHERVFRAFFTETRDIGNIETLQELALDVGLDPHDLTRALRDGQYDELLEANKKEAAELGITAAPTFIFENNERIVGAQSIETFVRILSR